MQLGPIADHANLNSETHGSALPKRKKNQKRKRPVEMPHLWKSTDVDFHELLGKVSQKAARLFHIPTGLTRFFLFFQN
jgi:hypothetical protein